MGLRAFENRTQVQLSPPQSLVGRRLIRLQVIVFGDDCEPDQLSTGTNYEQKDQSRELLLHVQLPNPG